MEYADFQGTDSGTFVETIEGQQAFVPNPLPPKIPLETLMVPLDRATLAVGELNGACRGLSNPYILIGPLQRSEALATSAMEGTYTSADKLAILAAGDHVQTDESTREVLNYIMALRGALSALKEVPICHRLILKAHATLLEGLSADRGINKRPGEYKDSQNWIGALSINDARYIPPPPVHTLKCMDQLEAYINREPVPDLPVLIEAALIHYQFEAIHPFADGNGRMGRMLISLMAVQRNLLDMPVLYVSPYIESNKDDYIDLMYGVSARGEWIEWITYFLRAVEESAKDTIRTIDALIELQAMYREQATQAGRSSNLVSLIDFLFEQPVLSIPQAAEKLNVTYAAAQNTVQKLVGIGVLSEVSGDFRPKLFFASKIINLTMRPAAGP